MPRVPSAAFGVSPSSYDDGVQGSCALNANRRFVAAHRGASDVERTIRLKPGTVGAQLRLTFGPTTGSLGQGANPSVALTDQNVVIEAHDNGGKLYYSVHTLAQNTLARIAGGEIGTTSDPDSGDPSIAVNPNGAVVEVHRSGSKLRGRLGKLVGTQLTWQDSTFPLADNGSNPSVTINGRGDVVVAYENSNKLYAVTGKLRTTTPATLEWLSETPTPSYDNGVHPSVAITADRWIYEVHESQTVGRLYQRIGRLSDDGDKINWQKWLGGTQESHVYDDGGRPAIAVGGKVAMQVHGSETAKTLFATASAIFDRANWMSDFRSDLKDKRLNELVMPASHDAGSYIEDDPLATQTLTFFGQLAVGVRYFDVRPVKNGGKLKIHHDDYLGVDLDDVIRDVHNFMNDHKELVILKFSHYGTKDDPFTDSDFQELVALLIDAEKGVREWLLTRELADDERIAALTLQNLLAREKGTVLVFMDSGTVNGEPRDFVDLLEQRDGRIHGINRGIRRYRDWYAPDPQKGDLTVFDIYSETNDFNPMAFGPDENEKDPNGKGLPRGQFPKFALFDGKCKTEIANKKIPCDLFLLSWTLTPPAGGAVRRSRVANGRLVDESPTHSDASANTHGQKINLLYTDVVQESRSTDVALLRNGINIT